MDYDTLLLDAEERMEKAVEVLLEKFRGMRTGRANPGLVDSLRVDYYGSLTPLKQVANISAPEPDQLVIKPFDPSALGDIEKAILKSDLGLNPASDGKIVRLQIPPLSQERRGQLAAFAKETAEETRVALRNIRRDANRGGDQLQKDKDISEDQHKDLKNEVQKLLKSSETKVDAVLKKKTAELTTM
jgi:ribosome recycling factor